MVPWRRVNELVYLDPLRAVGDRDHALVEVPLEAAPNSPTFYNKLRRVRRVGGGVIDLEKWECRGELERVPETGIIRMLRALEWDKMLG